MQHHSPMASVRIPPPAHDGGGLYNPFNAGPLGPPPPRDLSQHQHQQVRAVVTRGQVGRTGRQAVAATARLVHVCVCVCGHSLLAHGCR